MRLAACSMRRSSSTNGTRSRRASRRPTVVLPAPRNPRSATTGSASSDGSAMSAAGVTSSARATSASRRTEMLPRPASSWTRNRVETPERSAISRSVQPRSRRRARARWPSDRSRSGAIARHYITHRPRVGMRAPDDSHDIPRWNAHAPCALIPCESSARHASWARPIIQFYESYGGWRRLDTHAHHRPAGV